MKIFSAEFPEIYLQTINEADANEEYVNWLNDPIVNQFLETRLYQQSLSTIKAFIQETIANPAEHLFTIRLKQSHQHIGNIKVGSINSTHGVGEISLFIGNKAYWGKGIATKAIKLISSYSINHLALRKLSAGAYKPNKGSTFAFLKAGYQEDCIMTEHYLLNNQPCDLVKVCFFDSQIKQLPQITMLT